MDVLVIGGTVFVGRAIVDATRDRGHDVTVLHRGAHPLHRDDVHELLGDREHDLDVLGDRFWNVVIDTCGYVPRIVAASARRLAERTHRYVFISAISVYVGPIPPDADEAAPVHEPPPAEVEVVDGDTYGPLKLACEREVDAIFGERALLIRPGLIAGPHDPTGRFPYWVGRLAGGEDVLAPATEQPVQLIDARDLAHLVIVAAEDGVSGPVNATGPVRSFAATLEAISRGVGSTEARVGAPRIVSVEPGLLIEAGVQPWADLPLWLGGEENQGIMTVDASRARTLGLVTRPLEETAAATLAWLRSRPSPPDDADLPGLTPERQRELLARLAQGD